MTISDSIKTLLLGFSLTCTVNGEDSINHALMPLPADHTSMWWKEGFPGRVTGAPWHRSIETGNYRFDLDTESVEIPLLGPVGKASPVSLDLSITVDKKTFHCSGSAPWSRFKGPRLIESGRFLQRADVTDLRFVAEDGTSLSADTRLETTAWADRLSLSLAARPGRLPITAGEDSFGRVRGGFGLDGSNFFEITESPEPHPRKFTLEFWTFVPVDYQASKHSPWLLCRNRNELANGNYGILIRKGRIPQVRLNIGGGRDNAETLEMESRYALRQESWNHLAISYDGETLALYANGKVVGKKRIAKPFPPLPGVLCFGRRQDGLGDGYHFRGVVDEIRLYDRALTEQELRLHFHKPEVKRPALTPAREWTFREDGRASTTKPSEQWNEAFLTMTLSGPQGELSSQWDLSTGKPWTAPDWNQTTLVIDPVSFQQFEDPTTITIGASEFVSGKERPVIFEAGPGWHRINLDGIEPILPPGEKAPGNNAIERIKLRLSNPAPEEQIARLMFEKTARGFRQPIGTPITGISAILRDSGGFPTGIPVQLSKNWHNDPEGGVYSGQWFHGITQVRLPAGADLELELTLAYGHWGGVAAASHAQLSLVGWGSNQLWNQAALGSWGESICFEPDQVQGRSTITDVRPLMVYSDESKPTWNWTNNVGGGDFFRFFDTAANRVPHAGMQTSYHRQGPCLSEVTYAGKIGATGIHHHTTVSLARGDDLVRGIYQIKMEATRPVDFSRFVIFQIGADTYSSTGERKMALGDRNGVLREWNTQWGGNTYRTEPFEAPGDTPWASLHEGVPRKNQKLGSWANRGIVVRQWKARLGGKEAHPWMAERGLDLPGENDSSTLDILPPPGVTRLEPGDYIEATIEHIIMPQFARDYYGPNRELREALSKHENTALMIYREAAEGHREVSVTTGTLQRIYPDIRVSAKNNAAEFTLAGGLGYVPITITNLDSYSHFNLMIDGKPVDQSVHGNDFWQCDFDPASKTWSMTFNLPVKDAKPRTVTFSRAK